MGKLHKPFTFLERKWYLSQVCLKFDLTLVLKPNFCFSYDFNYLNRQVLCFIDLEGRVDTSVH